MARQRKPASSLPALALILAGCGGGGSGGPPSGGGLPSGRLELRAASYLGGNGFEAFRDCVVSPGGQVILVGVSDSLDLTLPPGGFDTTLNGGEDALVAILSADLGAVLAATFIGGTEREKNTYGVELDAAGNVYACGETRSVDFPLTAQAAQPTWGGGISDAFAIKLSPTLDALLYSTFLGGLDEESARGGLAVDASGSAVVVGWTRSTDFPTTAGSLQENYGGGYYDAFITKLSPGGTSVEFSTLLGGSFGSDFTHSEYVVGAALASDGSVVFTGSTTSSDFPTTAGGFDNQHSGNGNADVFLGKLSSDGSALSWHTFLPGSGQDWVEHRIALDAAGNAYVVGACASPDFPATPQAAQAVFGGGGFDIFVAKIPPLGGSISWATFVGGSGDESAFGVFLDDLGDVYVAGYTDSNDFPVTADASQAARAGGTDAVLVRLSADGSQIKFSTYLGGTGNDTGRFLNGRGDEIYVTGHTTSADFPTTNGALQSSFGGGSEDIFVAHFRRAP